MASTYLKCILVFLVTLQSNVCESHEILGIFPTYSRSHYSLGYKLMRSLADRGNNVTIISPFRQVPASKNIREIYVDGLKQIFEEKNYFLRENFIGLMTSVVHRSAFVTNYTLHYPDVQKLLHTPDVHFDAIVLEVFLNEAFLGFGHHFKAPIIGFSPVGSTISTRSMVGSPAALSYCPNPFLPYTDKMSFVQRAINIILTIVQNIGDHFVHMPLQRKIYKNAFASPKPPLSLLRQNVSLVLLNTHFTLNYPRPYNPNMIEIGGFHIGNDHPKLTQKLQHLLDNSTEGIIYFSMGTNFNSSSLPMDKQEAILKVFSQLNVQILWKWEDPILPNKPKNVNIQKWFPQESILSHENVKLFITHGGLSSISEAVYYSVPVIGIPIFGDQKLNMKKIVDEECGLMVDYSNLTIASLNWAIQEILSNAKYATNINKLSELYRDQPQKPLEVAHYWIDYVVRHHGSRHFHSADVDLNVITYNNLDVIFVFLFVIIAIFWAIRKFVRSVILGMKRANRQKKNN